MPPTNVKVYLNGFVLSTLLYDCVNTNTDQEGFLFGTVVKNVRKEISDHSMNSSQEDVLISICSSVPSGSVLSFYNNVGEINKDELQSHIAERIPIQINQSSNGKSASSGNSKKKPAKDSPPSQTIVGWYRFRRYSAMFPSLREMSTHRHLRELFSAFKKSLKIDTQYFVFAVLTSSSVSNFATHSYDYGFFVQRRDGSFKDLPFTILNLGDTRNTYRSGSMAWPFINSSSFNSVITSSWNLDAFFETENQIHEFHQKIRAKLDSLQEELAASDSVNASLEDDIRRISNEMQSLLAAQERLISAAAARELEVPEAKVVDGTLELAEVDNSEKPKENELNADSVKKTEEEEKKETQLSDQDIAVIISELISQIHTDQLTGNREISVSGEVGGGYNFEIVFSVPDETVEDEKCDYVDAENQNSACQESVSMDYDENVLSSLKEKPVSSCGLKRASAFPIEDDRSSKRLCIDKYFEDGGNKDGKSPNNSSEEPVSSAEQAVSSIEQEVTALSTYHEEVSSPESANSPTQQAEQNIIITEVMSCYQEEPTIPSPASNVEIVISEVIQSYTSAEIGDQTISTLDDSKVSINVNESDFKQIAEVVSSDKSLEVSETSKSLSDSDISCKKDDLTSSRCESAPAEYLNEVIDSTEDKKLPIDEGSSKNCSSNKLSSNVNPPFIIYATKKSDEPSSSFSENNLQVNEAKPKEASDENSQSSPLNDQKDEQKNNVPQGSVEK